MSGCLQVGSVGALGSYFAWLSVPSTQNRHRFQTSQDARPCMTTAASVAAVSLLFPFTLPFLLVFASVLFFYFILLSSARFRKSSLILRLRRRRERTGRRVCLVCPEMALKPALISSSCSTSQFRCLQLTGQHRTVHSIYPTLLFQPCAPSKESLVTVFRMSFICPSTWVKP